MKLTEELEGEIARLGPDERLIISLARDDEAIGTDGERARSFTGEIVRRLGYERVLVLVGVEGAATVPAGARLTDAEYVALNGFIGGAEARRILMKGHQTDADGEALQILRGLLDSERATREIEG